MKKSTFNEASYQKSNMVRRKIRQSLFEKNRQTSTLSYLKHYDHQTQELIKQSIEGPIPSTLPHYEQATIFTISYYRRNNIKMYKIRQDNSSTIDPHMAYESMLSLLSMEQITELPSHLQVIKQFENDLGLLIKIPYQEIQQLAIVLAGNFIIGREAEILEIINQSTNHLWILINHIYQRRISYKYLFPYLQKNDPMIYRAIYQMTNNKKDEIIYSIISSEELVNLMIKNLYNPNPEIQSYAIRILGNILAEPEDYAGDLTKYHLLDEIFPLLTNKNWEMRRDGCWLIANYIFQNAPANELLCKPKILERLLMMYRNEQKTEVRVEIYYILAHLIMYGSKPVTYKLALTEGFLEQCSSDFDLQEQDLNLVVLNLIDKLVDLGEEYINNQEQGCNINPFSMFIKQNFLKLQISSKTYSYNSEISELSLNILDKIGKDDNDFGMI